MNSTEDKVILLVLARQKILQQPTSELAATAVHSLDQQIAALALQLPNYELNELIARCAANGLMLDESIHLIDLLAENRKLVRLRTEALAHGKEALSLTAFDPKLVIVPLLEYSWQFEIDRFRVLTQSWLKKETDLADLHRQAQSFFRSELGANMPAGFPMPRPNAINAMLQGDISGPQQEAIIKDYESLPGIFAERTQQSWSEFRRGKPMDSWRHTSLAEQATLVDQLHSSQGDRESELTSAVLQWSGPNGSGFMDKLFQRAKAKERIALLIEVRTGINPITMPQEWLKWVEKEQLRERNGYNQFLIEVSAHQHVYDMALAFATLPLEQLQSHWWQLYQSVFHKSVIEPEAVPLQQAPAGPIHPSQPEPSTREEILETLEADEHEAFDKLEAPTGHRSQDDDIIEEQSTWNRYIRPFLQENVLALVAGAFLISALTFFAWYSWDSGPMGKALASVLLTLGATVGTGYICRFIGNLQRGGDLLTPESLFATLCFLSVPFNLILGSSFLPDHYFWGLAVGFVNLAILPWMARWLERPLGHNAFLYMVSANGLLYLPSLLAGLGQDNNYLSDLLPYLGFGLLFYFLRSAEARAPQRWRYNRLLYGGHFLLATVTAYAFSQRIPNYSAVALFLACAGLGVVFLGRGKTLAATIGVSLILQSLVLLIRQPVPFAMSFFLATVAWTYIAQKQRTLAWITKVWALHLALLFPAILGGITHELALLNLGLLGGLSLLMFLEMRRLQREIQWCAYAWPGGVLLSIVALYSHWSQPMLWSVTGICYGIIGYRRTCHWHSRRIWFATTSLLALLIHLTLLKSFLIEPYIIWVGVALGWLFLSRILKDMQAREHRATLLWGFTFLASIYGFANAFDDLHSWLLTAWFTLALNLALLMVCAHITRSSLPVFIALALAALTVICNAEPAVFSGMALVLFAALSLALSNLLLGQVYWEDTSKAERFLNRPFFLTRPHYLQPPLRLVTYLSLLVSLTLAARDFSPLFQGPSGLIFLFVAFLLPLISLNLNMLSLTGWSLLPLAAFYATLTLSLPASLRPMTLAICLWATAALAPILRHLPATERLAQPIDRAVQLFSSTHLIFSSGVIALALYSQVSWPLLLITCLPLIVFAHFRPYAANPSHRHMLSYHGSLLLMSFSLVGILYTVIGSLQLESVTWIFILASLIFATILWIFALSNRGNLIAYDDHGHLWKGLLLVPALIGLIWLNLEWEGAAVALIWFALHLWSRRSPHYALSLMKLLALSQCFVDLPYLWAAFSLLLLWILLEVLTSHNGLRVLKLHLEHPTNSREQFASALSVAVLAFLAWHMAWVLVDSAAAPMPHYLLYVLIPCCFWLAERRPAFRSIALFLFAYILGFWSIWLLPILHAYDLNILHALSLSLVLSLAVYQLLLALVKHREIQSNPKLIDQFSTGIIGAILLISALSFAVAPQLEAHFEKRFLFNGLALAISAFYLRFRLSEIADLQRAFYRLSLTGCLWSLGLFLLPYPTLIPWLIAVPGFYFLFRVEIKPQTQVADKIASISLLILATFVYVQQQPINLILFPEQPFNPSDYFHNAPLLFALGTALMRMHKHVIWRGLAYLGTILALAGIVLTGSMLSGAYGLKSPEMIWLFAVAQLFLITIYHLGSVRQVLIEFSGLREEELETYRRLLFTSCNLALIACLVYFIFTFSGEYWQFGILFACLAGTLHDFRPKTVPFALAAAGLIAMPLGPFLTDWPADVWTAVLLGLLALSLWGRRQPLLAQNIPNQALALLALLYLAACIHVNSLNPFGLLRLSALGGAWLMLPNKPQILPRQHQVKFWPLMVSLVLLCASSGYRPELVPMLALLNLLIPFLVSLILPTIAIQAFVQKRHWFFVNDWLESAKTSLSQLLALSVLLCFASFVFQKDYFIASELPLLLCIATGTTGFCMCIRWAARDHQPKYLFTAEVLLWMSAALLRWKYYQVGAWGALSFWDGIAVLALSALMAGGREVLKRRRPEFSHYFYYNTQVYALLGWLVLIYLYFTGQSTVSVSFGSLYLSLLYFLLARHRHKHNLIYAFLFANAAVGLYFFSKTWTHLQVYSTPALISLMVLAQVFRDELGARKLQYVRLYAGLLLMASSAWFNIIDFNQSVWYPMIAAIASSLLVVVGIALRVRIYLFLGSAFLLTNLLGTMVHLIIRQPPSQIKLFLGIASLVVGLIFLANFLLFQAKRQDILNRYRALKDQMDHWN